MTVTTLAVFDLDKTLTIKRSLESTFILFLLRRRKILLRSLLLSALFYLKHIWCDPTTAVKRNKLYLHGTAPQEAQLWVQAFMAEHADNLLSSKGQQLIRHHKQLGHTTILVTGSLDILVGPLLRRLNLPFDRICCTSLEIVDGLFTGHFLGTHYYGEEKAKLIAQLALEYGADLSQSFCYADSKSDLAMMSCFGHPVAVNPDKVMKQTAIGSGWQIMNLL